MVDELEPDANAGGAASDLPALSYAFPHAVWVPGYFPWPKLLLNKRKEHTLLHALTGVGMQFEKRNL
eukprot:6467561-Amphidinium_carterae.1